MPEAVSEVRGFGGENKQALTRNLNISLDNGPVSILPCSDSRLLALGDVGDGHVEAVGIWFEESHRPIGGVVVAIAGGGIIGRNEMAFNEVQGALVRVWVNVDVVDLNAIADRLFRFRPLQRIGEVARMGIDVGSRTHIDLEAMYVRGIGIGATNAKLASVRRIQTGAAQTLRQRKHTPARSPAHSDLLKASFL